MQTSSNQEMKRVCCLYRVSTKGQVGKDDIPMQKAACREFIEAQGWTLANEFSEKGVSGYKVSAQNRDAIQEIQRDAIAGKFDVLLVFMFDRIGRIDDETPFVVEWFVAHGIEVWSVIEGEQRFDSHVDKLTNYIRYWQASGESLKTSQRIKAKLEQMTRDGIYTGRTAPYGYCLVHKGRMGKKNRKLLDLEIDPHEAGLVCQIFEKTIYEGYGSHRLAEWVNDQGVLTHNGSKWQSNAILRILKNELYIGRYVSGEVRSNLIPELQIISETLFAQAQKILSARSTSQTEKQEQSTAFRISEYLLSGKLICADCGGRLTTTTHVDRYEKQDGTISVNKTRRYVCYHNTRSLRECNGQGSYKAEKLESAVIETLIEFFQQVHVSPQDKLLEWQMRSKRKRLDQHKLTMQNLWHELDSLKAEVVNVLMGNSKFSAELLNRLIAEKGMQIQQETTQADMLREELSDQQTAMKSIVNRLAQFEGWAKEFELCSPERKQVIILHLVNRIEVGRGYTFQLHLNTGYILGSNEK